MGRHLGMDFRSILVDLRRQDGRQNQDKIAQNSHRKNDENMMVKKMSKKSQ